MKHISNKLIGFALLSAAVVACTDEYDCNLQLEKPVDAEVSEYLASFDLLKTYITRTPESPFQLTSKVSASEFGTREVAFSTILNNLDGADVDGSFSTASCLQDNGSYSVVDMKSAAETAQEAGLSLFGGTLCSDQGQCASYYNSLIEPVIIPFVPEEGSIVVADFEKDALGTSYPLTGAGASSVVEDPDGNGSKVLRLGDETTGLSYSHPKFTVTLPGGATLGDCSSLKLDMHIIDQFGIYGAGMRVFINGTELAVSNSNGGVNAQGFGCNPNTWNRSAKIQFLSSNETYGNSPAVIIPKNLEGLTTFELGVGTASGDARYYMDNVTLDYMLPAEGSTMIDFESDAAGTQYPMTNGNQAVVEDDPTGTHGKVLHVGTASSLCSYTYPTFHVKLKDGRTLGDYTGVYLEMFLIDGKGKYGSGMRIVINGQEFNCGMGPAHLGAPDNAWGRIYIPFVLDGTSGNGQIGIPASMKDLTEVDIAVGSGSGEWHAYMDNIDFRWKADDQVIEKTPEEKKDIFTGELRTWIGALIDAGGETVKGWNVISEPLSKTNDANTFHWGEYLGETEYAQTAVRMARDTAKTDLDLFVSNTFSQSENLTQKFDELDALVKTWEADGVTKLDGYNILLHATYSKDAATQEANREAIVALFTRLAESGRLVRISDFTVQVLDEKGSAITTAQRSFEDEMLGADYAAFILKKYFEIIPAAQQYGISFSRLTEGNDAVLCPWSSGYNRTGMYVGIIDGLK